MIDPNNPRHIAAATSNYPMDAVQQLVREISERNARAAAAEAEREATARAYAASAEAEERAADVWSQAYIAHQGVGGEWIRQRLPMATTSTITRTGFLAPPPRRFPPAIETSIPPRRRAAVAPAPAAEEVTTFVAAVHGVAIERIDDGSSNPRWAICGERWRGSWQHRDALTAWLSGWEPSSHAGLRARQLRRFQRRLVTADAVLDALRESTVDLGDDHHVAASSTNDIEPGW